MAIVETKIAFRNRGEEIKRLQKKNDKYRLANTVADIHDVLSNFELSDEEKLQRCRELTSRAYW